MLRSKATIFVVDDNPTTISFLKNYLSHTYHVVGFTNVSEAKVHFLKGDAPDLVLTDYYMNNNQTGIDVILAFKGANPNLPIIVLSGSCDSLLKLECITEGADDFIEKPFKPQELTARIERQLKKAARRATV